MLNVKLISDLWWIPADRAEIGVYQGHANFDGQVTGNIVFNIL